MHISDQNNPPCQPYCEIIRCWDNNIIYQMKTTCSSQETYFFSNIIIDIVEYFLGFWGPPNIELWADLFSFHFRNWVVKFCPIWLAPNLLTFIGFMCCVAHFLLPTILDYDFTASALGSSHPVPSIVWFFISLFLFISHTLDGMSVHYYSVGIWMTD